MPQQLKRLILIATVLRMVAAAVLEFGNDEVYYFLYALDLNPNYFDHPPGVAWLIRLSTLNLLLTDEFFIRLGAIACSAVGTVLVYRLGTALKNERTGWYAAILYTANLFTSLIAGTFIIPDSPQLVAWLAARIRFYYEQFALALKLAQQAVELNASHFLLWLELGRCQQALGLAGPARESYHRADQLDPHNAEISQAIQELAGVGPWKRLRGWWRNTFHS